MADQRVSNDADDTARQFTYHLVTVKTRSSRAAAAAAVLAMLFTHAPAARAQTSWGIGPTASGELVFCDVQRDRVWKLDRTGTLTPVMPDTHCRNLAASVN